MKIAFFSTRPHDRRYFGQYLLQRHEIGFLEPRLDLSTVSLAAGYDGVCVFVNDVIDGAVIDRLSQLRIRVVALRCVGFNNIDLAAASAAGIAVVRVPEYSPSAVAEHTVALMLTLSRHLHKAYSRVRDGNFALRGLEGFTFSGRTVAIIGTGRIGQCVARILLGMGMRVLAFDPAPDPRLLALGIEYCDFDVVLAAADVVTFHCPLTRDTHHLINPRTLDKLKPGVMLINTSRGAVLDSSALITALKTGVIGYLGLDVYEQEGDLFFRDLSDQIIHDDVFQRLLTFPNVVITGHLGFFTSEALAEIARVTMQNFDDIEDGDVCVNQLDADSVVVN